MTPKEPHSYQHEDANGGIPGATEEAIIQLPEADKVVLEAIKDIKSAEEYATSRDSAEQSRFEADFLHLNTLQRLVIERTAELDLENDPSSFLLLISAIESLIEATVEMSITYADSLSPIVYRALLVVIKSMNNSKDLFSGYKKEDHHSLAGNLTTIMGAIQRLVLRYRKFFNNGFGR